MGAPRLAKQTRPAAAQPGGVPGCVAAATKKIGGRYVSRPAFRTANDAQTTGFYGDGRADASAWDRRQHGDLQPGGRRVIEDAVRAEPGRTGVLCALRTDRRSG